MSSGLFASCLHTLKSLKFGLATQQEAMVSNSEAAQLQKELVLARIDTMANGIGTKACLQALQIACVYQLAPYRFEAHLSIDIKSRSNLLRGLRVTVPAIF